MVIHLNALFLVASWFVSPVLSGLVSVFFYVAIDHLVLRRNRPLRWGLILLPILYFLCVAVNIFAIVYDGSTCKFWLDKCEILGQRSQKIEIFKKYREFTILTSIFRSRIRSMAIMERVGAFDRLRLGRSPHRSILLCRTTQICNFG